MSRELVLLDDALIDEAFAVLQLAGDWIRSCGRRQRITKTTIGNYRLWQSGRANYIVVDCSAIKTCVPQNWLHRKVPTGQTARSIKRLDGEAAIVVGVARCSARFDRRAINDFLQRDLRLCRPQVVSVSRRLWPRCQRWPAGCHPNRWSGCSREPEQPAG